MSAKLADSVQEQAIAEYQVLRITAPMVFTTDPRQAFIAGYLKGYLLAQRHFLEQMKKGMQ